MPRDLKSLHPIVRIRWILVRHRWIRWLMIAGCSVAVGLAVQSKVAGLDAARAKWDGGVEVLVLRQSVEAGDKITAADVSLRFVSPDLAPQAAVATLTHSVVAKHPLGAGEILVTTHIGSRSGPAGLLDDATVGISIPIQDGFVPTMAVGDRVGVVIGPDPLAVSPSEAPIGGPGVAATVIFATREAVLIAVPTNLSADVATAASSGRVTLVLLGSSKNPVPSPE